MEVKRTKVGIDVFDYTPKNKKGVMDETKFFLAKKKNMVDRKF